MENFSKEGQNHLDRFTKFSVEIYSLKVNFDFCEKGNEDLKDESILCFQTVYLICFSKTWKQFFLQTSPVLSQSIRNPLKAIVRLDSNFRYHKMSIKRRQSYKQNLWENMIVLWYRDIDEKENSKYSKHNEKIFKELEMIYFVKVFFRRPQVKFPEDFLREYMIKIL